MTTAPDNNQDRLRLDLLLYGNAYMVNGQRVDPTDVVVHQADEQCQGAEAGPEIRTQDQFLTQLDELLDNTLHDDACYIEPNSTTCVCILGRIRADLPPCGAVRPAPGAPDRMWPCIRTAHPASPDRHWFSEN